MIKLTTQVAIATLVLGLLSVATASHAATHLGQPLANHVSLVLAFNSETGCRRDRGFYRRLPSGELGAKEFRVRSGEILVITDFNWQVVGQPANFASNSVLTTNLLSRLNTEIFRTVYKSDPLNLTPDFMSMDRIGGDDQIYAGVQVGSGRYLCVDSQSRTDTFTAFHTVTDAEINGYLIQK